MKSGQHKPHTWRIKYKVLKHPTTAQETFIVIGLFTKFSGPGASHQEDAQKKGCSLLLRERCQSSGGLSQETETLWLAGNTQIAVAGHAHINTPHSLLHPPPHPHRENTRVCICPSPRARGNVGLPGPAPLSCSPCLLPCPCRKPMDDWTRSCAPGFPIQVGEPARRPSVFAYNLHVLTQPFPSLRRALPS